MSGVIATIPRFQFCDTQGRPLVNGKLYTYLAGTTKLATTYQDAALSIKNENPVPLDATGSCVIWLDPAKIYKFALKDSAGRTQPGWPIDNISGAATPSSLIPVLAPYATLDGLAAPGGASLIGFTLDAPNTVPTTVSRLLGESISVFRFMTPEQIQDVITGVGALDLTKPIQAAVDYVYQMNLGDLFFPRGVYSLTSVVRNWDTVRTVNLIGAGMRATLFQKFDASTTPLFDWSANANILETYSNFEGFTIIGKGKAHHGIRLIRCARFRIRDVYIGGCDYAIDNQGSLVWSGHGMVMQGNNRGLSTTRATNGSGNYIYPNEIILRDSMIAFNTNYGIYGEYSNGMRLRDCDIEKNGTAGDQNTGAVIFKQTHVEAGIGSIVVDGCWFEGNKGWTFTMDSANNLTSVSLKDLQFIANESGRAARIINARSALLEGIMAVTPGDTISVAADHCIVQNCTVSVLTDTSTRSTWTNVVTTADPVGEGGFSNGLNVSNGKPLTLSWARGVGKATFTPDTNGGHLDYVTLSGLHRFKNQIGFFEPVALANARAQAMFVDAADNKLKFKDINGVVTVL